MSKKSFYLWNIEEKLSKYHEDLCFLLGFDMTNVCDGEEVSGRLEKVQDALDEKTVRSTADFLHLWTGPLEKSQEYF